MYCIDNISLPRKIKMGRGMPYADSEILVNVHLLKKGIIDLLYLHCYMQVCLDLGASLSRLLNTSSDSFWQTGWVYVRVQNCVSFIYNGWLPSLL